ncbi:hypothetical protein J2W30_004060 [Variovorax boronicumulans]|uniref:hypothetical protein n=1 Tax=Variovorax boronicumulans TaxID=436515 RepID=UPI002780AC26|nr:hypothetical protein [Variovorax boronicumulans]MDQ0036285.1 hypothetical protein [Variovorax boronicumulans]
MNRLSRYDDAGSHAAAVRSESTSAYAAPARSDEIERGVLVFVPLTDPGMHTDNVAICIKRRRPLPVAASILIERLVSGLAVLGD